MLRSTTLALSGKNRLKFRSKKCSCDELTRKITLIVFDYTHDELEPKPYKFKTSSKQKKGLYYVSKYTYYSYYKKSESKKEKSFA